MTTAPGGARGLRRLTRATAERVGWLRRRRPRARLDSCWLLTDGSVCVDGWLVEADGIPEHVDARIVRGGYRGPWSPLLRKARPDVAAHVFGDHAPAVGYGVVGQVAGQVGPSGACTVELRSRGHSTVVAVPALLDEAVPEEVFSGLVVDYDALTPQSLGPIVGVARSSRPKEPARVTICYRHAAMTGSASIHVVVPVFREYAFLRNLFRVLAAGCDGVELTIVCDDPAIADELVDWVRRWNEAVYDIPAQIVVHDVNAGFAAACNSGWRAGNGETVVLLNSDVLLGDAADLRRLADGLAEGIAATAPVLQFPDGTLQHAGMELVDAPDFPGFVLPGHPGKHGAADALPADPFEVPMLTGAALCVRRDLLADVGGVPAVYGRGDFEDVLLSLALRDRGSLLVDPRLRWTHVEGASYQRDLLGGIAVTLAKSVVVGERTGGRR